ncbi:hypothetical protein AK812_SmicGene42789 [Symbiodinium microadriaticum]|uniref:Uncharacterized protein n=1 Tax=Symbiodinium microadriaticum TaxID=2951 RepID=A0A1Q9C2P7_SYMMI|nr:hypothetical protein AK812_SmicGene42789 [Symbiodinium microadriaticum]
MVLAMRVVLWNPDLYQELFGRLNDSVGIAGAQRVIIEAYLLEERLEDATKLVEEELAKAKQAKSEACQIIMLKASISVHLKIAQGRPRDAIDVADEAEKILLGHAAQASAVERDERGAGELLLLVAKEPTISSFSACVVACQRGRQRRAVSDLLALITAADLH